MKEIKTYFFIIIMCSFSALILSVVATSLRPIQEEARESYRYKELLRSGDLLPDGASYREAARLAKELIVPMLTDVEGNTFTFEEKNINYIEYLESHAVKGYAKLPLKLYYSLKSGGIILPVSGNGLWAPIYGYIGIASDGDTLLGITWYDQKETPGLGGEITNPQWQEEFVGKKLFHGPGKSTFGIDFVAKSLMPFLSPAEKEYSVDAISGATLTIDGVQTALQQSISPYIPLLKKMNSGQK